MINKILFALTLMIFSSGVLATNINLSSVVPGSEKPHPTARQLSLGNVIPPKPKEKIKKQNKKKNAPKNMKKYPIYTPKEVSTEGMKLLKDTEQALEN